MKTGRSFALVVLGAVCLVACATTVPPDAMRSRPDTLEYRELQSRRFDTRNEKKLLTASAQVLQDLGFNIDESETKLGVLVASKNRDATEAGQVIGAIVFAVLTGAVLPVDKDQKIRVSVVTKRLKGKQCVVRATFQRVVWNTQNNVSKTESIEEPEIYQKFFEKLSKSVYLTAHEI